MIIIVTDEQEQMLKTGSDITYTTSKTPENR